VFVAHAAVPLITLTRNYGILEERERGRGRWRGRGERVIPLLGPPPK